MNIKEAKDEIKNAMTAYFTKDEYGHYLIPAEKQRPVVLISAPGLGKTAIMEQIAMEMDVNILSYSMTHHTRQSALGLPFITTKVYDEKEYEVSEYTMSEIIAAVYDKIAESDIKEGILFLDEINCISETLEPVMLQFLQYKVFGRHKVPQGWIVVAAGNPPEYNNSAREFDIATWDRLKRIDIDADYNTWKQYALNKGVHPSITTYLENKRDNFYIVESTVDGKEFVTARGWDDLSDMIQIYEKNNIEVKENLLSQYIRKKKIAKDFSIYYKLFNKYKDSYNVPAILSGKASEEVIERGRNAKFDERIVLIGLMLDSIFAKTNEYVQSEQMIKKLFVSLKKIKNFEQDIKKDKIEEFMEAEVTKEELRVAKIKSAGTLSNFERRSSGLFLSTYNKLYSGLKMEYNLTTKEQCFRFIKKEYDKIFAEFENKTKKLIDEMQNMFVYCENSFGIGQEILILVTELAINEKCAIFISKNGCEKYFEHSKNMLINERFAEISLRIENLEI